MASGWQEAAAQQAEEVSARLRQLLTQGLGLLRAEFGVELGLQPHLYPSWVFLAVPIALLLFLVVLLLSHCASSRDPPSGKARPQEEREPAAPLIKAAPVPSKTGKTEDAKKKSKKKQSEKAKPNGRPVEPVEEEIIAPIKKESPKQQPPPPNALDADKKNDKAKKNKKKQKVDVKQTQQSPKEEKKEAEEGNWETKISNKEKRQQRKRDKGADGDLPETITQVTESFTLVSSQPTNIRKSKGPSEVSAVNGSSWNEKPTKVISQVVEEKWAPPAAGKKKAESCTWNQDAADSNGKDWSAPWSERSIFPGIAPWTTVESRIASSEQRPPPYSSIGLNSSVSAGVSDAGPQSSVSDSQWEATPAEPTIDDEWSGLNGLSSTDPSSDWNAPAEEWGNYGEEEPGSAPQIEEQEQDVPKVSDDEKEKEEGAGQTAAGKTKKKKKKKKKQGEESGSSTQDVEGTREAMDGLDAYREDSTPPPPPVVIPSVTGKANESKETVKETRVHATFIEPTAPAIPNVSEKSPPLVQQPQEASAAPTNKQNSAAPTNKQNSAAPTNKQNSAAPTNKQNSAAPTNKQNVAAPTNKQNSAPPTNKQNSAPPPSQGKSEESWESPKQMKKKKKARRET